MQDAQYALLVQYAMDMATRAGLGVLTPPADPRLAPQWQLCGYLTALDHIAFSDQEVCYGFLVREADTTHYAAVIRGTHGTLEWLMDAEFVPTRHPVAGCVESGFWSAYETLTYRPVGGIAGTVTAALVSAIRDGTLTVVGHSLGAAIATYLTFDMAGLLRERLSARLFASPQPGDAAFCKAFDARVLDYQVYDYASDIVPRVPAGPDYTFLAKRTILPHNPRIRGSVDCWHAITTYEWLLDSTLATSAACLA